MDIHTMEKLLRAGDHSSLPDLKQHLEITLGVIRAREMRQHENVQFNPERSAELSGRRLGRSAQPGGNPGDA